MTTTDRSEWSRRRFLGSAAVASGVALAALSGCSVGRASSPDAADDPDADAHWGGELAEPGFDKPTVTFTDMDGKPFPFEEKTKGKLTLLTFGYTFCPDTCPTTMNSIARAIETLDGPGSDALVLFVGVDIARDTPEQLKTWLGRLNPTFVGLTGTEKVIAEANKQMMLPPIEIASPDANGDYLVGHGKQVFAFSPKDDLAHRYYNGEETRQQTWVKDLPRLDQGQYK